LGTKSNESYINLVLSPPEIVRIIDRRMYHRIPIELKVSYLALAMNIHFHLMSEIPTNILANHEYKSGIITDISGSGLRLQCEDNLEIGSQIIVCMNVKCRLSLLSKITRKEVISDPNGTVYLYGIYFDIITEKEREKIIEFIFENEIHLRSKNRKKA
jgi:c-di-GMP-binding flagellar brake protein YcgR